MPGLKNLSDDIMRSLDMSVLVSINNAATQQSPDMSSTIAAVAAAAHLSGGQPTHADPGIKMAMNLESLQANPIDVPAGKDDRVSILHPGRFLAGTVATAKKQWLQGRETHGLDGITPLATYDLSSIGLGGSVTNQGWKYLHSPGSRNINLNMFSPINMATSASMARKFTLADNDGSVCIGEDLKEIMDMETFCRAVRALCAAARQVMPWNYSYAAIDGFLNASNYGAAEIGGRSDRAAVLVRFVNYVLGVNAVNYQQREPFLTTGDLLKEFSTWCATQAMSSSHMTPNTSPQQNTNQGKNWGWKNNNRKPGNQQFGQQSAQNTQVPLQQSFTVPPPTLTTPGTAQTQGTAGAGSAANNTKTICKRYNAGTCTNHFSSCYLKSGTRAYHICSVVTPKGICGSYHPAIKH